MHIGVVDCSVLFGVTVTLTSNLGLLKSLSPILYDMEITYSGYILGKWNVAYCLGHCDLDLQPQFM